MYSYTHASMFNFDIALERIYSTYSCTHNTNNVIALQWWGGAVFGGGVCWRISICQNSKTCIKTLRNNLDFFIKQNNKLKQNETNF